MWREVACNIYFGQVSVSERLVGWLFSASTGSSRKQLNSPRCPASGRVQGGLSF